jgi:hypothetical protein
MISFLKNWYLNEESCSWAEHVCPIVQSGL